MATLFSITPCLICQWDVWTPETIHMRHIWWLPYLTGGMTSSRAKEPLLLKFELRRALESQRTKGTAVRGLRLREKVCPTAANINLTSLLDLLPPPSPLVPYPSPSSEQGIHSLAFHPLFLREPSSSLPRPAFVHPLSPYRCLDNIDPPVAGFATPPHSTPHPQPPPQGAVPCPTSPCLCAPPLPSSSPGQRRHPAGETPSTP